MNLPDATDERKRQPPATLAWCVLAILFVAVSWFAYQTREYFVDDAFIGFQYIKNLLAGHGFAFYSGQKPVEGVTNIGWLLLLTPLSAAFGPTMVAKVTGLVLLLATLAMTMLLGRSLAARMEHRDNSVPLLGTSSAEPGPSAQHCLEQAVAHRGENCGLTLVPTILLASSFEFVYFPLAGMETALLAVVLLAMACVTLRRPYAMALPVLGAFAFLVHPEAAVVYPLYVAISWFREKEDRRKLLIGGGVWGVLIVAITAIRFGYFGDIVPNTFHSKPSGVHLVLQNAYGFLMGKNTNIAFPITGWLAIPVLVLGYRRLRRAAAATADMLAVVCGVGLMFAVYSPADWSEIPRYFAPYLPAALFLLWAGMTEAVSLLTVALGKNNRRVQASALAAVAFILMLTSLFDARSKMQRMDEFPGYVLAGKTLVGPTRWMREHLPREATIATRRIGAAAYYSDRKVFDYTYGLPERDVAKLVGRRGARFDTPTDPALATIWRARSPDYLLEDALLLDGIIGLAGGVRERFMIHGIEYHVIREFSIGRDVKWVLAERTHGR